jgi:hypothetical protein
LDEPKLLVTCLAADRKVFYPKVLTLFKTIKAFGGKIANSQLVANFENHVDPDAAREIRALGVEIRLVEPLDSNFKYANKLRMLETEGDYDVLIALDCDIAVARDFSSQIKPDYFQARIASEDPLTIDNWKEIFSTFGLALPSERYKTFSFHPTETIPYFNSGVLFFPKKYIASLRESWARYISELSKPRSSFSSQISKYLLTFIDQVALALALVSEKVPVEPLTIEMNFPSNGSLVDPSLQPDNVNPYLLHYHRLGKGFLSSDLVKRRHFEFRNELLLKTGYKNPDMAIRTINALLKKSDN